MARLTHTIFAAAFTGALSVSAAVAGQPQALGLFAAADPVPMRCEAGMPGRPLFFLSAARPSFAVGGGCVSYGQAGYRSACWP